MKIFVVKAHEIEKPVAPNKEERVAIYGTCSSLFGTVKQKQSFGVFLRGIDL